MGAGRAAGVLLFVVGLGLALVGATGAAGVFGGPTAVTTTAAPSPTILAGGPSSSPTPATPTEAPTEAPTTAPTAEPTLDLEGLVRAFFVEIETALREGRAGDMFDALAPAVLERYGAAACQAELDSRPAEPSRAFEIFAVLPPASWDYVTDEVSTTIPDAITVVARVTAPGPTGDVTEDREVHVQLVDGEVRWFTDCGTPLG